MTAACFFFSWDEKRHPQSLTASQNSQRIIVENTGATAKSGHEDGQAGKTRLRFYTLLGVIL